MNTPKKDADRPKSLDHLFERLGEAVERLHGLSGEFGQEEQLLKTLAQAQEQLQLEQRRLALEAIHHQAKALAEAGDFTASITAIEEGMKSFPQEADLARLLDEVVAFQRAQAAAGGQTIEEARCLIRYPASNKLVWSPDRLPSRRDEVRRRQELAQSLEMIERQISERAWSRVLSLTGDAQAKSGSEAALKRLLLPPQKGQRRSGSEHVIAGMDQSAPGGDLQPAMPNVSKALHPHEQDTLIQKRREEPPGEKLQPDDLGTPKSLFSSPCFDEVEKAIWDSVVRKPSNRDAQVLPEALRGEGAVEEENESSNQGRPRGADLGVGHRFGQALDVPNSPGRLSDDPILPADWTASQAARREAPAVAPTHTVQTAGESLSTSIAEPVPPRESSFKSPLGASAGLSAIPEIHAAAANPSWMRPKSVAILVLFLVTVAEFAVWLSRQGTPAVAGPSSPAAVEHQVAEPSDNPASAPQATARTLRATRGPARERKREPVSKVSLREFDVSTLPHPKAAQPVGGVTLEELSVAISATLLPLPSTLPVAAFAHHIPEPVAPPPRPTPGEAARPRIQVGGNSQQPALISASQPKLPDLARERGVYGVVSLEVTINKEGTVTDAKLLSGHPLLAPAAREAALTRRYRPATLNGEPLEAKIPVQFVFRPEP